jgi:hypothetical protein
MILAQAEQTAAVIYSAGEFFGFSSAGPETSGFAIQKSDGRMALL